MRTKEQVEKQMLRFREIVGDKFDTPEETRETLLAAGGHDALMWVLELCDLREEDVE